RCYELYRLRSVGITSVRIKAWRKNASALARLRLSRRSTSTTGFGLLLPLHNARRFMRIGVFFNLGNLPVAHVVDPAILIIVLLACAGFGGNAVLDNRRIAIGEDAMDGEPKGLHVE